MPPSPLDGRLLVAASSCPTPGDEQRSINSTVFCTTTTTTSTTTTVHCQARQISVSYTRYMPATRRGGPIRSLSCGCSGPSSCCAGSGSTPNATSCPPLAHRNSSASSAAASSASSASSSSTTTPTKTSSTVSSSSSSSSSPSSQAEPPGASAVRTIWPNELAKRIARATALNRRSHHQHQQQHQQEKRRAGARRFEQTRGDDDAPDDDGVVEVGGAGGPVIIDCRPFIEFNKSHIRGAVHINCTDKISRRRLQQGKITVLDLLSARGGGGGGGGGAHFGKERGDIVVYDEATSEPACVQTSQPLHLVVESLRKEGREPLILKGGLSSFRQQHESLCASFLQPVDGSGGGAAGPPLPPLPSTPDIENADISPILPFLFLGNEQDAQDLSKLQRLGIGLVLNVTAHLPLYHYERGGLHYKRLPANDSNKQNLRQYFEEAFEFIEDAHRRGQGLLVHCQAGVSRSATIVIAYLMKHTRMTMTDAYKFVKGKRPIISPNLNFMGQLLEFEEDLNSGVTPRILKPKLPGLETVV
ncbi:unnamed protein product [Lampetra fluviatilis]